SILLYSIPIPPTHMLPANKKKAVAALKRLNGLSAKLEEMIENDEYCPKLLEIALAMKGHVKYVQGTILESHMNTCAPKKLASKTDRDKFIKELLKVVGLSNR
ncbi:MAG: metal-sensitive transcriptional regulator, partial [Candidatus Peribacteraceae bacterium]|nr:metal-sensitive transcriptional regulator [Candidatus Peribacteraceae bacterium]